MSKQRTLTVDFGQFGHRGVDPIPGEYPGVHCFPSHSSDNGWCRVQGEQTFTEQKLSELLSTALREQASADERVGALRDMLRRCQGDPPVECTWEGCPQEGKHDSGVPAGCVTSPNPVEPRSCWEDRCSLGGSHQQGVAGCFYVTTPRSK